MAYSVGQSHLKCQLCVTEKTIKWKCIECNLLLCETCKNYHHKIKTANDHQIVDIKTVGSHVIVRSQDFTSSTCQKHPDNACCLFCESCDTVVCPVCVANAHNKHKLIEIKVAYEEKKEFLLTVSDKLEKEIIQVDENEKSILEFKEREISRLENIEKAVKNHGEDLKRKVDIHIEKLTNEVAHAKNNVSKTADKDIGLIAEYKSEACLKREQIQDLVQSFDISAFFNGFSSAKKTQAFHASHAAFESVGDFNSEDLSSIGTLSKVEKSLTSAGNHIAKLPFELPLTIDRTYTTDFKAIVAIITDPSRKDFLWISEPENAMYIHLKGEKAFDIIARYEKIISSMAMLNEREILLGTLNSKLDVLDTKTGKIRQSIFDVSPLRASSIHISNSGKVIVGAVSKNYPEQGKRCVIVFNKEGIKEQTYETDKDNKSIFTYPRRITSTLEGLLHVGDVDFKNGSSGIVIVLDKNGSVLNKYYGKGKVDNFSPAALVTTNTNCVLVADMKNHLLHVLNSEGHFLSFVSTEEMGISWPYSLAFDEKEDSLYVGCNSPMKKGQQTRTAKIYKIRLKTD